MGCISMYCSKCGKRIPDDSNLCPYCGSEVDEEIKEESTETDLIKVKLNRKSYMACHRKIG